MSIDTGQNLIFNANFPIPNVGQSSQQFRDNFAVIKTAIENLHGATNTSTSVLNLTTNVATTGAIQLGLSYKNNVLTLPIDGATASPSSGAATAGMIHYRTSNTSLEFHDGTAWRPVVFKDANGVVSLSTLNVSTRLALGYNPSVPTDAVPLSYVQAQIATVSNSVSSSAAASNAAINAVQADLNNEKAARIAGDANLQSQVTTLSSNLSNTNIAANAVASRVTTLESGLSAEVNARVAADTIHTTNINNLNSRVSNAEVFVTAVSQGLVLETNNRTAADQSLSDRINAVAAQANASSLADEITARQQGDATLTSDLANATAALNAEIAARISADSNLGVQIADRVAKAGDTMTGALYVDANFYVGNSTSNAVNINRTTGDINTIGNVYAVGDVAGFSDESLKDNVRRIENALDKVDALDGVFYERNDLGGATHMGLIAQNVQPIIPEVVRDVGNGMLGIAYGNITALLIEAIKELRAEVNYLKNRPPQS